MIYDAHVKRIRPPFRRAARHGSEAKWQITREADASRAPARPQQPKPRDWCATPCELYGEALRVSAKWLTTGELPSGYPEIESQLPSIIDT